MANKKYKNEHKKNILVSLGLILNLPAFGQNLATNDVVSLVKKEVKSFIDSAQVNAIRNGKYMVYTMQISYVHKDTFCFSIGCIENKYECKYINYEYIFTINDEVILIGNLSSEVSRQKWIQKLGIYKIDSQNRKIVMDKLYDNTTGGIIGINPGLVCCIENNKVNARIYDNADNMPTSIYDAFYPHPQINLIYSPPTPSKKRNKY